MDLRGQSYSEIVSLYFDHLPLMPTVLLPCYSTSPETLFRALRCENEPREIRRLSYPPPAITRLGRLNIEGHPVFYASDKPLIAILEIGAQAGYLVYVGIWRARDFYNRMINPFLVDYQGSVPVLLKQRKLLLESISKLDPEIGRRYLTLYRLVTEMLLGNNNDLSSVIGHFLFHESRPHLTDIVIYPSIKARRQHANFAFNTKMADEHFDFMGVVCLRVLEVGKARESGKFACLKEAYPNGHEMVWKRKHKARSYCA